MRCVFLKTAILAAIVCSSCLMSASMAWASPGDGGNCANCHSSSASPVTLSVSPPSLSGGPNSALSFTITATQSGSQSFRLAVTGKANSGQDTTVPLTATVGTGGKTLSVPGPLPSESWTNRVSGSGAYYSSAASSATSFPKSYSFTLPPGALADGYTLYVRAAGPSTMWSTTVAVPLTVNVPEPGTMAMLFGGALVGFICWRGRKRLAAK